MLPSLDTQHVAESLALLIDQFKNKTVITGYLSTLARRVQDVENVLWDIIELRRLDVATGIQLDKLGALVGEKRIGRNDTDYRNGIRLRIRVNRSKGRIVDIIDVASLAGQGVNIPTIIEYPFLAFEVDLFGQTGERYIADLLSRTRAATSYGILVASDLAASSLLLWDDAVSPTGHQTFSDAISGGLVCASSYGLPSDFTGIVLASSVSLTSLAPTSGSTGGATNVTLTGLNLGGTTGVTFGGVAATSIVNVNSTTVTCLAPAHAAGAVDVTITTANGSSTLLGGFTYSAGAAPTLTSVSTSGGAVGDIDGTYPATLTGTGFTPSGMSVTFGGTPATSVVYVSATQLTCVVPAHATGAVSVVVTTPNGSNGANTLFRYFSPAELAAVTSWFRADYPAAGPPWLPTSGAGSSGTHGNLVSNVNDPTQGTAVNGHKPAVFASASGQNLNGQTAFSTLFTAAAGSIVSLSKPASAVAPSGNIYDDPAIAVDGGFANTGLTYTTAGYRLFIFDSAASAYKSITKTGATGAWHSCIAEWDSSNLNLMIDGAAATPVAAGPDTLTAGVLGNGRGYGGGTVDFQQLELFTLSAAVTTQQQSDIRSYFNTRYFPSAAQV